MARVLPFSCVRVSPERAQEVVSLPFDFYSDAEAFRFLLDNPRTYMHFDAAGVSFPEEIASTGRVGYTYAKALLEEFLGDGTYVEDDEPAYYVYRMTQPDGTSHTGIMGCVAVDDYFQGKVKKHEATRQEKEEGCKRLMKTFGAQTSPLFLTYPSDGSVEELLDRAKQAQPLYSFTDAMQVLNEVWRVTDADLVRKIEDHFAQVPELYISDGHHRATAAAAIGYEKQQETGEAGSFLSIIYPSEQVVIYDYNRALADLNGLTEQEFLELLKADFQVEGPFGSAVKPQEKGVFGMYLGGKWYKLTFLRYGEAETAVERLDVSVLQDRVLGPLLGIKDPRTDDRIDFVRGTRGIDELERRTIGGKPAAVCFALYPTQLEEFFAVADAGLLMPPKSTWFEPKARSGILMHRI